jgi:CBS domain containing-hemolysin-like protein
VPKGNGDEVQADGLQMRVLSVIGRRVKKVRVTKELLPPPDGNDSNQK